jgi:NDP-sugar pyrophosphorylase family protein
MQCVILAGGLGTRMRGVTKDEIPKALIPIASPLGEKPFAWYQLRWLAACGVRDVVYSIGFLGHQIRAFVGDGSAWGVKVTYVDEGKDLLGTGGALRKALDEDALKESFFIVYGDSFLPLDLSPIAATFKRCGKPALMTVLKNENRWDKSNVIFENKNLVLYKKNPDFEMTKRMHYIDYGLSALKREVIEECVKPGVKTDLAAVFEKLSVEGRLQGFEVYNRFYEIGSAVGLNDLRDWLSKEENIQWLSR